MEESCCSSKCKPTFNTHAMTNTCIGPRNILQCFNITPKQHTWAEESSPTCNRATKILEWSTIVKRTFREDKPKRKLYYCSVSSPFVHVPNLRILVWNNLAKNLTSPTCCLLCQWHSLVTCWGRCFFFSLQIKQLKGNIYPRMMILTRQVLSLFLRAR